MSFWRKNENKGLWNLEQGVGDEVLLLCSHIVNVRTIVDKCVLT